MNSLYVTSVERFSGKTAVCLALGAHMIAGGRRVGYLKPLSLQPFRVGDQIVDEDAAFVKNTLGLTAEAYELSPVVVTPDFLRKQLRGEINTGILMERVKEAHESLQEGNDVVLLEGGASLREGYVVELPTVKVAEALSSCVLVVVKYRDEVRVLDDCMAAKARLRDVFCGVLINRVHKDAMPFVTEAVVPHLERNGIPVYGILPEVRSLAALTVLELINVLEAEVLTKQTNQQALVENVMVGAMSAEAALSRFRKQSNKAVVTGGDRTDIQLAALETSTACLVLTGNLRPSPVVIKQAEEFGVTVMLVRKNTMETIEAVERIFGKTRLGEASKMKQFQSLMDENFDYERLYKSMAS
jgi:uncharacterized protein